MSLTFFWAALSFSSMRESSTISIWWMISTTGASPSSTTPSSSAMWPRPAQASCTSLCAWKERSSMRLRSESELLSAVCLSRVSRLLMPVELALYRSCSSSSSTSWCWCLSSFTLDSLDVLSAVICCSSTSVLLNFSKNTSGSVIPVMAAMVWCFVSHCRYQSSSSSGTPLSSASSDFARMLFDGRPFLEPVFERRVRVASNSVALVRLASCSSRRSSILERLPLASRV
mmetsp:Transcript_3588/g.10298  ORF Transcript_3588/g.10298 Transcript_3588/m.10298 type:complete len:229 (-) Transcript_3588:2860-3546(-)